MRNPMEPAFPVPTVAIPMEARSIEWGQYGLTKRELFTLVAMGGLLANAQGWDLKADKLGLAAVAQADATLAALDAIPEPATPENPNPPAQPAEKE